jgi:hypothetical protein
MPSHSSPTSFSVANLYLPCRICKIDGFNTGALFIHYKLNHLREEILTPGRILCGGCSAVFPTMFNLGEHIDSVHGGRIQNTESRLLISNSKPPDGENPASVSTRQHYKARSAHPHLSHSSSNSQHHPHPPISSHSRHLSVSSVTEQHSPLHHLSLTLEIRSV